MSYKFVNENTSKPMEIEGSGESIDDIKIDENQTTDNRISDIVSENEYNDTKEDEIGIDFLANQNKRIPEKETIPQFNNYNEDNDDDEEENDILMDERYGNQLDDDEEEENDTEPRLSYEETQQQKAYYLSQLKRLSERGSVPSRKFGIDFPLSEIKAEVFRLRKEIEINRGVNYCKQGLLFCVSTIEMLNTKYDPFSIDLDGWSTSIMADKESYNEVFEELYEKYSNKITMSPEIKLISMVAGSAMMFHLQKTMLNNQMNSGGGGFLDNIISKFSRSAPRDNSEQTQPQPKKKESVMKGPSVSTDDLLKKLNNDEFSDASSIVSEDITFNKQKEKKISIPKKKGRPPKK